VFGAVVGCSFGSTEPGAGAGDGGTSAGESTGLPSSTSGSPPSGTGGGDASSGEFPVDGTDTTSADSSQSTTTEGDSTSSTGGNESSTGGDESSTGGDDVEVCDGRDNDGDGGVDEGSPRNSMCNGCLFVLSTDTLSYFAICPDEVVWQEAREACKVFGPSSDLATIDNADDNELLISLTAEDHFIGLSDLDEEGEWLWLDGTISITGGVKQDYNGWSSTQPSGGASQNCGELDPNQDGWADAGCGATQRYICEHPV